MEWYLKVVRDNYANFDGRARRKEYWMFVLINGIISVTLGVIGGLVDFPYISSIYSLAVLVPAIAVSIRRMHDVGKSGWFTLIPFYNIYLAVQDSEPGSNQYGLNPKTGNLEIEDNLVE